MLYLTIQELEAAINYWRSKSPAEGEELRLCLEASALAKPYALMIMFWMKSVELQLHNIAI